MTLPAPAARRVFAGLAVASALLAGGCGEAARTPGASGTRGTPRTPAPHAATPRAHRHAHRQAARGARVATPPGSALAALGMLTVKGRAPMTGYARAQFGDGWASVDGCDERDRILARDLRSAVYEPGSDCAVSSGRLADPYTAAAITYARGGASEVDIDHVVALGDAWQKGAQQWPPARRREFANDPLNLLAVDSSANRQKGDGDAATWLPPNKAFRCAYVARQVAVKQRYHLSVTAAERAAVQRVLDECPRTPLPRSHRIPLAAPVQAAPQTQRASAPVQPKPPTQRTSAPVQPKPPTQRTSAPVFANCDAVRAAHRAPLLRGDPAYEANPRLDRDKDGIACE